VRPESVGAGQRRRSGRVHHPDRGRIVVALALLTEVSHGPPLIALQYEHRRHDFGERA
jgi:hypothetical protein